MNYRRVTVLGATGFIGRYVVQRLAAEGAVVSAVARHASAARFLKPMGDVGQIALIDADVTDDRALGVVLAGAEAAVNLVGILYERDRRTFQALHARLPVRLAAAAQGAGVKRIVHLSALGADAAAPAAYARSKAAGEADLRAAFPPATILRPSLVFGPEDGFFNRFAALARVAPALPLIGGGATRFQPVYVGDVADAVVAALARPHAAGATYELGGPEVLSFRALLELMLREIGRERPLVNLPFPVAMLEAALLEWLPAPPLTRDQVRMLRRDSVVSGALPGLAELGVAATALELVLPGYLARYRRPDRTRALRRTSPAP